MRMDKKEFLSILDYPPDWIELDLYSDELFEIQAAAMLKDLGKKEFEDRKLSKKYGYGAEHYRYGAFLWITKNMTNLELDKLRIIAENDPDPVLRTCMLKDIDQLDDNKNM